MLRFFLHFRIDCIGRVARGEADLLVLEPEEIYVSHRFFHDAFFVLTEIRTLPRQAGEMVILIIHSLLSPFPSTFSLP